MVRFDEYESLVRACRRLCIRNVHFHDGFSWETYFRTEKRALIVANHGPFLGPLAWVAALFPRLIDEGYGHYTYSAIAHPIIRNIPVFARLVGFEKKDGRRLRAADYVDLFESGRLNILSVAPEGEYALYGDGVSIQPFRSHRSLEIGLRAECRFVLAVARGLEHWQRSVSIAAPWRKQLVRALAARVPFLDRMDEEALEAATQLSLSGFFGRIPDLHIASEIYEPALTADELADDRETRDEQLRVEGERMRREMMRMLDELRP